MSYISTPVTEVKVGDRVQWQETNPAASWRPINKSDVVTSIAAGSMSAVIRLFFKKAEVREYPTKDRWGRVTEVPVKEVIKPSPFKVGDKVMDRYGDLYIIIRVGDKTVSTKAVNPNSWHSTRTKEDPMRYALVDSKVRTKLLASQKEWDRLQRDIEKLEAAQVKTRKDVFPSWQATQQATFGTADIDY